MLSCVSSTFAQTENTAYDINEAWFISAGFGGNLTVLGISDGLTYGGKTYALDVAAGKWFTPSLGLRFGYSGLKYDNNFGNDQTNKIGYFHGDVMVDPIAYFKGYDSERFYSIQPYLSFGVVQCYDNGATDLMAGVGLFNAFRISDKFDINLDLRAAAYKNNYLQTIGVYTPDAVLSATIGATYKFGRKSTAKIEAENAVVAAYESEVDALKKQVTTANNKTNDVQKELNKANADLKNANSQLNNQKQEMGKLAAANSKKANPAEAVVTFDINSATVSSSSKTVLGFWAKSIKENPNRKYTLTGYADDATGSATWNEKLSKARAEAVAKVLVDTYGVKESQLDVQYKGGVAAKLDKNNSSSRIVILE